MDLPSHGANPLRLYESLGLKAPEEIIDFSENVNPAGPPQVILDNWSHYVKLLAAYPDPTGEPFLSAVASFHHVAGEQVVLGNGASEIFAVLARRYTRKRVILIHPTFSEYEATLQAAGADIIHVEVEDIASWRIPVEQVMAEMTQAAAVYICTPNNPTGVLPDVSILKQLIEHGRRVGCEIILDEAFIDWVDESYSFISAVREGEQHVIIVRSMTKLYAIPGIRLGYMVAAKEICESIKEQMPHWHINGLAAVIGASCLQCVDYRDEAIARAKASRQKITEVLRHYQCEVSNSVTNYVAFRLRDVSSSQSFFAFCLERGIVLRHSFNFKGMNGEWFRVGMKDEKAMAVLERVLTEWFEQVK